jgi:hypothetical protein
LLYSEPQPDVHQFVDIEALGWGKLRVDAQGLALNCSTLAPLMLALGSGRVSPAGLK